MRLNLKSSKGSVTIEVTKFVSNKEYFSIDTAAAIQLSTPSNVVKFGLTSHGSNKNLRTFSVKNKTTFSIT